MIEVVKLIECWLNENGYNDFCCFQSTISIGAISLRFENSVVRVRVKMINPPPPTSIPLSYWHHIGNLNVHDPDFFVKLRNFIVTRGSL